MNIEDFISRYIDGELDSESEADLHHRLAVSPEARAIFRAQIALRAVARDSRVLVTPTPALRNRLFERLEEEEGMGPVPPPPPSPVAAAVAPVADTFVGDVPHSLPSRRLREEGRDSRRRRRALALLLLPALLLGLFFVTEDSWRGEDSANVAMKSSSPLKNGDAAASQEHTAVGKTSPGNTSAGNINGSNTDIAGDAFSSRSGALSADGTGSTLSDAGSSRVASRKSGYAPSSSWTRPSQRRSVSEGMASRLDDDRVVDASLKTLPATTETAPVSAKASAPTEERDIPLGTFHSAVQPSPDSLNDLQQHRADSTSAAHTIASLSDPDRELAAPPRLLGPDPDAIAMASSSVPPASAPPAPPADGRGFAQDMSQDMKEKDLMIGALAAESKPAVAKPTLADNARGSGKGVRQEPSQQKTLFSPSTWNLRLDGEMPAEFDFHRQLVAETALEFAPTRRFLQAYGWRAIESKNVFAPRLDYLGERMQVVEPESDGDQMLGFGVWYYFLW